MIRRVKRIKPKKRFTPVQVADPHKTGDELEHLFLPPLKPRRRMFVGLSVVFGLWVGVLVFLYTTTVYPQRHGIRNPAPASQPATHPTVPATTGAA